MTATAQRATATQTTSAVATQRVARAPLRRACACGARTPAGGECESCKKKKVQARFALGAPDDAFEREADAVADQVMRRAPVGATMPSPVAVQRHADRASDGTDAPASVDAVLARGGAPLDARLRRDMEGRFGHDFSHVRTHTDADAARSAHEIGAAAYTAGHHLVFGAGRYRPASHDGRRLIAHELTHVLQQTPGVVRRAPDPPKPAKPKPPVGPAKNSPKLNFKPATNTPPCACVVFIHHNERNARLVAESLHKFCKYNLAIVDAQDDRDISLPTHGPIDPNELFPEHVAKACWNDDKPCVDFMKANEDKTAADDVKAYAERQFFLEIKRCSKGFTLPVVGIHNNTTNDTDDFRTSIKEGKADLPKIEGKTFDKSLKRGDEEAAKKKPKDTLPFEDFTDWMKTRGSVLKPKKTNIFIWCKSNDNTKCQIGDPTHPDNVVWVTNDDDFEKLRGKKVNVALQTEIDPKGDSQTDLSSLFVTLGRIVNAHHDQIKARYDALQARDAKIVADALRWMFGGPEPTATGLGAQAELAFALWASLSLGWRQPPDPKDRKDQLSQLRFVNIESPHSSVDTSVSAADFRVDGLNRVRTTLAALNLDCCDDKPAAGETESAAQKLEKAVRAGPPAPKAKAAPKAAPKAKKP